MRFTTILLTALAGLAAASPIVEERAALCSAPLDTAQCCDVSVDGILVLECNTPTTTPKNVAAFKKECAAGGQSAQCCTLPLAGDALLCTAA